MTTSVYSPPAQTGYPPCWGNPRSFDPNGRECLSCGVRGSCKDRVDAQKAAAPATTYAAPYTPPATYAPQAYAAPYTPPTTYYQHTTYQQPTYVPATTNPWSQQQARPGLPVVQTPQPAPAPGPVAYQHDGEFYGRYNDPYHYAVAQTPLPPRYQLQGETFAERFMKNMFLGSLEAASVELTKGIRQMVLPPSKKDK